MRRRMLPEPDIATPDPEHELQQTFALLLPIRRQRLSRSERLQREAGRAVEEAHKACDSAQAQVAQRHKAYLALREGFAGQHQNGRQKQERLLNGLEQERQASAALAGEKIGLSRCQIRYREQQDRLEQAQQEMRTRQRELEKLEYLIREREALR